jgi:hypothetical protein
MTTTTVSDSIAAHAPNFVRNADGTITITLRIPATEDYKVAKHGFVLDNTRVPDASHLARYIYGRRMLNDLANSSKGEADLTRDDAQRFIDDYYSGVRPVRSIDPVTKEARDMAKRYLFAKLGASTAKEAILLPKGAAYFVNTKVGVAWQDSAVDAFITKYDLAQTDAGKPELGFTHKARVIVAERNATDGEADVDI